jgi:REP element-mobilizing transposase RayT
MTDHPRHLPQLRAEGAVYFVTWRLNDRKDTLSPAERTLIAENLEHFNGERYRLAAYVVMDDHVHVVVFPLPPFVLGKILQGWKSFTAHALNKLRGVSGTRWMKDSHTRALRNEREIRRAMQYILDNPQKRWPNVESYPWVKVFDVLLRWRWVRSRRPLAAVRRRAVAATE